MKYTYQYLEDKWTKCYWFLIRKNSYKKWDWDYLSKKYPKITCEIFDDYPNKNWNWYLLFDIHKKMLIGKEKWINTHRLKVIKALQIQRHWKNCISNSDYKLARKMKNKKQHIKKQHNRMNRKMKNKKQHIKKTT